MPVVVVLSISLGKMTPWKKSLASIDWSCGGMVIGGGTLLVAEGGGGIGWWEIVLII